MDQKRFNQGVRAAGGVSVILLGFLYTVAAPTDHFRARIPFLLGSGGAGPLVFLLLAFECTALVGLLAASARSLPALAGASLVAVGSTAAIQSGAAARFMPQFPESEARWILFACLAALGVALLVRERLRAT